MKKLISTFIIIFAIGFSAKAQLSYGPIWKTTYEVGIPMGDLSSNFISHVGWRGIGLKGNWFVADNITLGVATGFNGFYQKEARETYNVDNIALTGTRMKYVYTVPLIATAQYVLADMESFNPYFSFGFGPYYTLKEDQLGRFYTSEENWQFGINPEFGILIPFNIDMGFVASVGYNSIFYNLDNIGNLGYLSVSVGLYFN